tara:strand:- start:5 stop:268 length:264 start_codon:yes stop_codon:yes gene_type:complete
VYNLGRRLIASQRDKQPRPLLAPDPKNIVPRLPYILRHVADRLSNGGVERIYDELTSAADLASMEEVTEASAKKPELKVRWGLGVGY